MLSRVEPYHPKRFTKSWCVESNYATTTAFSGVRASRQARYGFARLALCLTLVAQNTQAQNTPAQPTTNTAEAPSRVERPRPLVPLTVAYPEGAQGEELVVVELTLNTAGRVEHASAVTGALPFTLAAERAGLEWVFTPARRIDPTTGETQALAARIRVEVHFRPDVAEPLTVTTADEQTTASATLPESTEPTPVVPEFEVTVEGHQLPGARRLSRQEVRVLPGAFGDPFRAIEVLPGVTPVASGLPFFYVRGAPPGNGGYFFGDIPMPALFHAGAGPGVIHPAFIDGLNLYPGTAPIRYGRFAGAIVAADPASPEGRARTELSLRLVDVGAFREQPFANGDGSVMLAGRYSYTGLLVPLIVPGVELRYWDYQSRVSHALDRRNTVTLLAFGGYDFLAAEDDGGTRRELYDVTFHRAKLSFTHLLAAETALSTSLIAASDDTSAGNPQGTAGGRLGKQGLTATVDLTHRLSDQLQLRSGVNVVLERLDANLDILGGPRRDDPIERDADGTNLEILPTPSIPDTYEDLLIAARRVRRQASISSLFAPRNDTLAGVWVDFPWQPTAGLSITPGVRLDLYKTGSAHVVAAEPRITTRLRLAPRLCALHATGLAHQPPSIGTPIPGLSATVTDGLQRAWHSHGGLEWNLTDRATTSVMVFQSALFGGSDALGLLNLQRSDISVDAAVDRTTGHSYGLEVYARGSLPSGLSGFVSYTLSRATRTIGRLRGPSTFDRTHVLNLALSYDLGRGFHAGGRGMFYTGGPAEVAYREAALAPPRGPAYLRLDWRLEKRWPLSIPGGHVALVAETLNTTLAKEAVTVSCYAYGCSAQRVGPVTIPSLGVEAKF